MAATLATIIAAALREAAELVERARKPDFFAVACAIVDDRRAA